MGVCMTIFITYISPYIMENVLGFEKTGPYQHPIIRMIVFFIIFFGVGVITAKSSSKKKQNTNT